MLKVKKRDVLNVFKVKKHDTRRTAIVNLGQIQSNIQHINLVFSPAKNYVFKANNKHSRKMCEI